MGKMGKLIAACLALLLVVSGCGGGVGGSSAGVSAQSEMSFVSASALESQMEGSRFVNATDDMTFEIAGQQCAPGQTVSLDAAPEAFTYKTADYEREQLLFDIAVLTSGDIEIVATSAPVVGYTMEVFEQGKNAAALQYMLVPQGLYWMRCGLGQKLYMGDLPQMPMDELLEIYPNAVLPLGKLEVEWPGGYTYMLWCYEPLYNLRIGNTGVVDVVDGEALYGYVDWNAVESTELTPGAPLFTDIVSVGSMWALAVRFEDGQGNEHIYVAHENGMGGDAPGLILQPLSGRILTQAETEAAWGPN